MVNLNVEEHPSENSNSSSQVIPLVDNNTSTSSSNTLEPHKGVVKKNSFYKKIKKMIVPKSIKNEHDNEKTPEINVVRKESKKKLWKNIKTKVAIAS